MISYGYIHIICIYQTLTVFPQVQEIRLRLKFAPANFPPLVSSLPTSHLHVRAGLSCTDVHTTSTCATVVQATVASLEISTLLCIALSPKHVSRLIAHRSVVKATLKHQAKTNAMAPPKQKRTRNSTSSRASANLQKTEVTINVYDLLPVSTIQEFLRICWEATSR